MSQIRKHDTAATHITPGHLTFTMFTKEDMQKLCVTKICTPLTLDALGHPLPGGLYDRALGIFLVISWRSHEIWQTQFYLM